VAKFKFGCFGLILRKWRRILNSLNWNQNLGFSSACIKYINQPDASISQIYCSSFRYSSTCFGHPHAHHQELINCSNRPARPRPTTLLPPRSSGKPEAATAVYKLLMMGMRMPETYWAVSKRRAINLRDWYVWLVDLFEWNQNVCCHI